MIKALDNRFHIKFMQLEIGLSDDISLTLCLINKTKRDLALEDRKGEALR